MNTASRDGKLSIVSQLTDWIRQNLSRIETGDFVIWTFVIRDGTLVHIKAEISIDPREKA